MFCQEQQGIHVDDIGDAYGDGSLTAFLEQLLQCNPEARKSAAELKDHPFLVIPHDEQA